MGENKRELMEVRTSARGRKPLIFSDYEDDHEATLKKALRDTKAEGGSKRGRPCQKSRLVDITSLLGLPQRQAAEQLGISESMLCKRYKECTQRKWPYRYLGKVEKKIAVKEALKEKVGVLPESDEAALQALYREREQCLAPVTIRITEPDAGAKKRKGNVMEGDEEIEEWERERGGAEGAYDADFNPADVLMMMGSN